jgi:hypothetical protein
MVMTTVTRGKSRKPREEDEAGGGAAREEPAE